MKPKTLLMATAVTTIALSPLLCAGTPATAQGHEHQHETAAMEKAAIPGSIQEEHRELHQALAKVLALGGKTGEAAKAVEEALHPHFLKEEEYALPELGLLQPLAAGKVTPDMRAVAAMAERLEADLLEMLAEHKRIGARLEILAEAAREENRPEGVAFAEALLRHARTEEEVLYPAAILVGKYVRLKLGT